MFCAYMYDKDKWIRRWKFKVFLSYNVWLPNTSHLLCTNTRLSVFCSASPVRELCQQQLLQQEPEVPHLRLLEKGEPANQRHLHPLRVVLFPEQVNKSSTDRTIRKKGSADLFGITSYVSEIRVTVCCSTHATSDLAKPPNLIFKRYVVVLNRKTEY